MTLTSAKLVKDGDALHVTTGPAVTYWNPANKASGDYTVKATFKEPKYMNLNSHPHPYGLVIAGNDLGTDQQSYLYCAAYGNGNFIVRDGAATAREIRALVERCQQGVVERFGVRLREEIDYLGEFD